jgi:hypothetical protein
MSNRNNGDRLLENHADLTPPGDDTPEGGKPGGDGKPGPSEKDVPADLTVEEHARNMKIDAPVFAAVMQSEKWAGGKRVPEAVFKQAVEGFLKAPMGGKKSPRKEEAPKHKEKK